MDELKALINDALINIAVIKSLWKFHGMDKVLKNFSFSTLLRWNTPVWWNNEDRAKNIEIILKKGEINEFAPNQQMRETETEIGLSTRRYSTYNVNLSFINSEYSI